LFSICFCSRDTWFSHRHWTVDDGLPINEVNWIKQDTEGYIWFSTYEGLVRFDGKTFSVFNTSNFPQLKSNRFEWIVPDPSGGIWFVTGGINQKDYLYFYKKGEIKVFEFERNADSLNMLPQLYNGKLIVLNNYRVYQFTGPAFTPLELIPAYLRVRRMIADSNSDEIWTTTDAGVVRIDGKGTIKSFTTKDGLLNNHSNSLHIDFLKRVWVSSQEGVNYIQNDTVYTPEILNNILKNHTAFRIAGDRSDPNRMIFKLKDDSLLFLLLLMEDLDC